MSLFTRFYKTCTGEGRTMTSPDVPAEQRPAGHAAVAQRATRPKRPKKRSFALRNWPVRRRLVVVIVLAAVMGLVFGGLRVTSAIATADSFARTSQLAALGQAMETERDVTAGVAAFNNVAAGAAAAKAPKAVLAAMAKDEGPELTAQ